MKKYVFAERFISTLKNKISKFITSISKNVYINKLHDIVNEYNKTYGTVKIKAVNLKSSTCIDVNVENNSKDPKFEFGHHVRISKYKTIFAKG